MTEYSMEKAARAVMNEAVLPDVSPGSAVDPVVRLVSVIDSPIEAKVHEAAVEHPQAGGRVVFCGVVRDHDEGRAVLELEYSGHPSAEDVLAEIAAEFAREPDVLALAVSHRVGCLAVGDVAIVAAVATAHRREAFDICARLVDEVKHRLPIWKRQVFPDGTDEWVHCP
ncbi:MAG: molybdenum cofactor biosynthesis protein MoaE [Jatrophihabitans sp.]